MLTSPKWKIPLSTHHCANGKYGAFSCVLKLFLEFAKTALSYNWCGWRKTIMSYTHPAQSKSPYVEFPNGFEKMVFMSFTFAPNKLPCGLSLWPHPIFLLGWGVMTEFPFWSPLLLKQSVHTPAPALKEIWITVLMATPVEWIGSWRFSFAVIIKDGTFKGKPLGHQQTYNTQNQSQQGLYTDHT